VDLSKPDYANIYTVLKEEIDGWPRSIIGLVSLSAAVEKMGAEMPTFLQSPQGQAAFAREMRRLETEHLITPVGRRPYTQQGLHQKYRINRIPADKDGQLLMEIIRSIKPPASVDSINISTIYRSII